MSEPRPPWLAHLDPRWLRPDWRNFVRPDWRRFMPPGAAYDSAPAPRSEFERLYRPYREEPESAPQRRATALTEADIAAFRANLSVLRFKLALLKLRLKAGYNPDQPRAPAGSREGGQWTSEGGSGAGGRNDPRILSDATPDNDAKPGAQYAQNRPRGAISVRIGGQMVEVEGGQAARLVEAQTRAEAAVARVRELDPSWRPSPSAYESVEGLIRSYDAEAQEAQARASELARVGIGPGPFAGESMPARGPERNYNAWERSEGRRIFSATGCHTCGTFEAGTVSDNPILDHQPPSGLNFSGAAQRLYPQCPSCSLLQGGWVRYLRRSR